MQQVLTFGTVLVTFSLLDNSKTLLQTLQVLLPISSDIKHDFTGLFLALLLLHLSGSYPYSTGICCQDLHYLLSF